MPKSDHKDGYGTPSVVELGRLYQQSPVDEGTESLSADETRWQRSIVALSGEAAEFDADNLLTNELSYAQPLDVLCTQREQSFGTFVGVGAFQNFTYAGALNAQQLIIIDVRPANIAYFLLMIYLLRRCTTPDAFIAHLFCRPQCASATAPWLDVPTETEVRNFLDRVRSTRFDPNEMEKQIQDTRQLASSLIDASLSEYISAGWAAAFTRFCIEHFARFNVDLTYMTWGLGITSRHPSMADLIETRSPVNARPNFFLSPILYARVRKMALDWRIIPVVGDLGDPAFCERYATWNAGRSDVIGMYTSNVENYLITRGSWQKYSNFISSLSRLPLTPDSVIVKAYFQYNGHKHPLQIANRHECVFAQRAHALIQAYDSEVLEDPSDIYLKVPYIGPSERTE